MANTKVTTNVIADDAITGAKIADDAINSEHYTDGSIDTAHIADDQVTLAKMAGLARGKIIYGDSSGNPAALALGSNGQVLKSDGTDIAWGTDSSGVALDDISTGDAATTLATSAGNITIDAQGSDTDIIFKGTDGSTDTTFLTLDGSEAGAAIFNSSITIQDGSGANVGAITNVGGNNLTISGTQTNHCGLSFATNAILPATEGATNSNTVDLGASSEKFKDLHMGGTLETANLTIGGAQGSDGQVLTSTGSGVAWEDVSAGPTHKTFGTSSIMIGDSTTGTIDAANYNTAVGVDVFDDLTTGDNNSAFGYRAGYNISTGGDNTLIGHEAGSSVSTASYNTIIGALAYDGSNAANNTAVGYAALGGSVTGGNNTAVGYKSLEVNAGGAGNTAIGYQSGDGITSGSYNVAVGYNCLSATVTADANTAVGNSVMVANTSGTKNVAVGQAALDANTSGSNIVAIGVDALGACTDGGGDNVAVGTEALASTNGTRNLGVGYRALTAQSGSADNLAIGYDALVRQTTGANGNIAIGNYAGRAVVSSASTSQLLAIGHSVASNASGALAGYQNCFVGYNIASASGLAGAFRNTALGMNSLQDLTTGDNNTCIGNMAGNSIDSATNNLCLGYQAGESGSPSGTLTSGSNTIVLGDDNIGALYCTQSSINTSDRRDKADITNFTDGLDFIKKMQPVTYKWDRRSWYLPRDEEGNITDEDITKVTPDGSKKENVTHVGFIAQDVETLEKEIGFASDNTNRLLTNLTEDGNRYGMKYERLVTVLVNAVKELSTKLDAAETRIKTLEDA